MDIVAHPTEAATIAALTKAPELITIEGRPVLLLPPQWQQQSFEKYLPAPARIIERPIFTDTESFARYFSEFETPAARIYVDEIKWTFTTIFDGSRKDQPGHGEHSAHLQMHASPEWKKWKDRNANPMTAATFAAFIENNIDNIGDNEFPASRLLDMCRRLRVSFKGDVAIDERDADGERSLVATANTSVKAETKEGEVIPFPEFMPVNLRIFRNAACYAFKARLRWNTENSKVTFQFDLQNVETIEEAAFNEVIKHVEQLTDQVTLRGAYKS